MSSFWKWLSFLSSDRVGGNFSNWEISDLSHHIACPNWYNYSLGAIVFTFISNALKLTLSEMADAPVHGRLSFSELEIPCFWYFKSVKNNDILFFRVAIVIFCTHGITAVFNHPYQLEVYVPKQLLKEEHIEIDFPTKSNLQFPD